MLGANPRALPNESASPYAVRMSQRCHAFGRSLVTAVQVISLRQRQRRRPHEILIEPHHRTSRVAQCTVDAHAELLVEVQLLGRLQEFARAQRWLIFPDQPRFYLLQLDQEVAER